MSQERLAQVIDWTAQHISIDGRVFAVHTLTAYNFTIKDDLVSKLLRNPIYCESLSFTTYNCIQPETTPCRD